MTLEQYIQIATNLSRKTGSHLDFIPLYDDKYWLKEEKLLEFRDLYVFEDWYYYTSHYDFSTKTIIVKLSKSKGEIKTKLKLLDSLFKKYFTHNDLIRRFGRLDDYIR